MRVFLTGATGFIGSRIVPELIGAGHQVIGLTRSQRGADALAAQGASAHFGTLEQPDTLADGAARADAVIHTAFDHEFSRFVENCEKDRRVIEAIGATLEGSSRPFLITSGTAVANVHAGRTAVEDDFDPDSPIPRKLTELAGQALLDKGVSVAVVRLPQVHDPVKQGLVTPLAALARETGVSAYVGDGMNVWPGGHVSDVARLYRLALERHEAGARWHAVAEEGVTVREIAAALGAGFGIPVRSLAAAEAPGHFGWLAAFAAHDLPASSARTRERLGWEPRGPSLLEDLRAMDYGSLAA